MSKIRITEKAIEFFGKYKKYISCGIVGVMLSGPVIGITEGEREATSVPSTKQSQKLDERNFSISNQAEMLTFTIASPWQKLSTDLDNKTRQYQRKVYTIKPNSTIDIEYFINQNGELDYAKIIEFYRSGEILKAFDVLDEKVETIEVDAKSENLLNLTGYDIAISGVDSASKERLELILQAAIEKTESIWKTVIASQETARPTINPTAKPTVKPTVRPTVNPTEKPSKTETFEDKYGSLSIALIIIAPIAIYLHMCIRQYREDGHFWVRIK